MGTTRSFNDMLNEHLTLDLMREEWAKRDYFYSKVEKEDGWVGGNLPVPFEGAMASSVEFGALTAENDISEYDYVRGNVSAQQEVWGTMVFNQRDLWEHGGPKEKTFLKILPQQLNHFMDQLKMKVSINLLSGPHLDVVTVDGTAGGVLGVARPDRFTIGQKLTLIDGNTAQANYYVIAIDMNDSTITLSATRGGAAADVSAFTVAQSAKVYEVGVLVAGTPTNKFQSVGDALLSAANGGGATLHGVSKVAYPFLQAQNISGAAISASNLLEKLFDAFNQVRVRARGSNAREFLMSYKHLGTAMKLIETQKGGFKVTADSRKASQYGWDEIEITSVKGTLKLVGIQEMPDDKIYIVDWDSFKFCSNGGFKDNVDPDGNRYHKVRGTTGYKYIVDMALFGELVVKAPHKSAVIHSIPNY